MTAKFVDQRSRIHALKGLALIVGLMILFTHPRLGGSTHEIIERIGFALVVLCIAGRMWSILYIGSRKNAELVTSGPYSMTRNPLYLFSTIGAVGVGLIHGSIVVALLLGVFTCLIFSATAAKEARHLGTIFGPEYADYARRTPLFWPNPSLYREPDEVTFSPKALRQTLLDGMIFLMAFPLLELIEKLQDSGGWPVATNLF